MEHPGSAVPQSLPKTDLPSIVSQPEFLSRDYCGLIRILRHTSHPPSDNRLRAIFEEVEALLGSRDRERRTRAIEFLEALQDSCAWDGGEPDAFQSLMGRDSRRIWSALNAIRSDLAEHSVFEEEVGIWRVVHQGLAA